MITASMDISPVMRDMGGKLSKLGPGGRRNLFSAAANAIKILVQRHLLRIAPARHESVSRLPGARPTGHLSKGARAVHFTSTTNSGSVIIPIPGISRAFRDVTITPRRANALTIPIHASAYGRRAGEMRSLGFKLFTRKKADGGGDGVLYGTRDGETLALYILKKRINQSQDRSLLPSDREIGSAAAVAAARYLRSA